MMQHQQPQHHQQQVVMMQDADMSMHMGQQMQNPMQGLDSGGMAWLPMKVESPPLNRLHHMD